MSVAHTSAIRAAPGATRTVHRIAVGVGGHQDSRDAVALGARLAGATGAEMLLVAVHPDPLVTLPEEMNWKSLDGQSAALLAELQQELAPAARTRIEVGGSVPRALDRVVRHERRDLLVVGSSRHATPGCVGIGKRTRAQLGHLECALAIAPRGSVAQAAEPVQRVAVGYDGSPESRAALALAAGIAAAADAQLEIHAVIDDRIPPIGFSALAHGGAAYPVWEEAVLADMQVRAAQVNAAAHIVDPPAHTDVSRGRPADALIAISERADLLVIGSRRWGAIARLLLGSTGEALVHGAQCPLIVVPRPRG